MSVSEIAGVFMSKYSKLCQNSLCMKCYTDFEVYQPASYFEITEVFILTFKSYVMFIKLI